MSKFTKDQYEIEIDHSWTEDEQVAFVRAILERVTAKLRMSFFRKYNVSNRTKKQAAFASKTIYDWSSRQHVPNPKYNSELQIQAAEDVVRAGATDSLILLAIRTGAADMFCNMDYYIKKDIIKNPIRITARRILEYSYPKASKYETEAVEEQLLEEI
jgi:hypothetical protein